ncbi:kelch-like protein 10 isoform X2 [Cynoglossus semilaevis]|uniref:kelch-like protein 10 isoform X2 n=1 Tax=Cynoglossus semilaevis TaxID=244447 RepID=UPI000495A1E6|nr:kelch-like protein 10 isoform X2 [Cynoglossus semilaevis]
MSWFNEYRLQGKFCDALIKVENVEYKIHKVIISDCSPYFIPFFEFHSSTDASTFDMFGLCPDTMRLIIEFAYTGSVSVTECNVEKLMLASDMLNIMSIVQVCSDFLGEQLSPENSIGIWKFSKVCSCPELQLRASHYIFHHFEEVFSCEEFLHLTMQELNEILGRDELSVKKEGTVFEAILHWVAHKPKERCKNLAMLFSKFRVALTSAQYIHSYVLTNEFVRSNAECIEMIYICGGFKGQTFLQTAECYNPNTNQWTMITPMIRRRCEHGVVAHAGCVYAVGGNDGICCLNCTEVFNPQNNTWHMISSMKTPRSKFGLGVINGQIYAVGGRTGAGITSKVEYYDSTKDEWFLACDTKRPCISCSCCVVVGIPNMAEYVYPRKMKSNKNV